MSKMQLKLWQRLGSLATAVLMVPIAALVPPAAVKAASPLTQPGAICPGAAMLEPNDPDVQALRSLIQKHNISITYPADDIGDRPLTRREFSYALRSVLFSVRQKLIDGETVLPSGDLLLVERLSDKFAPNLPKDWDGNASLTAYFRALMPLTQQKVTSANIREMKSLIERYKLTLPVPGFGDRSVTRYEFAVSLKLALVQIQQKLALGKILPSQQDLSKLQELQNQFLADLSSLYGSAYEFSSTLTSTYFQKLTAPNQQNASAEDIRALQVLGQRYGVFSEAANVRSLTRYQFAAVLNAILDRVNELIASGSVDLIKKEDLAILQRLQEVYASELATLRGRVDSLEARTTTLERQQFSTTTKLSGEVISPISPMPPVRAVPGAIAPTKPSPAQTNSPVPVFSDQSRFNQPGTGNTESYNAITENAFLRPGTNPLSTFSIDVDTASYSNVRRFINEGQLPPKDAVRIEELINYFPYDYPQPEGDKPFSVTTDVAAAPWNPKHKLVQIGLKGKQLQTVQPSNLVFLVDVSGSMDESNKLPLVKQSLCLLVQELTAQDRVTLVVYAGNAGLVLPPTPGDQKQKILDAIDQLEAGGSTAGGAGIELAYKLAQQNFLKNGNNRVILATDGDFNVGVSSDAELVQLIEQKRDRGIFLTVLGFGTGNTKDSKMEQLADKGNGNYAYIDTLLEAKKVLVNDLRGTLFAIAKDVKIQVEFNPAKVQAYRLIGYENRLLRDQDFNDDTKDAGEIGAGHTVTALYEIVPAGMESDVKLPSVDPLKYQQPAITSSPNGELMQIKLRYKNPKDATSQLIAHPIFDQNIPLEATSANLKFAAAVAMFGMVLRESEFKGQANFDTVLRLASQAKGTDRNGYRAEFLRLVDRCKVLLVQKKGIDRASTDSRS